LLALIVLAAPAPASIAAGAPVSLLGLALRAWAAGYVRKDAVLTVTGPYSMVRNPLYLGTLLAAGGLAIASTSIWVAGIVVLAFMLLYVPAIEQEEQHLAGKFPEFAAYVAQVPRLIPRRLPGGDSRSGEGFRWSRYLFNREYNALIAVVAAYAWLGWLAFR
jgi:protein-S-isoprenylcysteine O-methyltransferase Ste14